MENKELTRSERLVGKSFNPSQNETVAKVKQMYAEIIDIVDENFKKNRHIYESTNHFDYEMIRGNTLNNIITSQMWVVKALTFFK